jgi:hypothetical protein
MNSSVINLPNGDFTTAQYLKDHWYQKGHMGPSTGVRLQDYMVVEDCVHQIHQVVVHRFRISNMEDPDLYAAEPMWEWQSSEMGKFITERSVESPVWHRQHDIDNYGYQYAIEAFLKGTDYSFWVLKWGHTL